VLPTGTPSASAPVVSLKETVALCEFPLPSTATLLTLTVLTRPVVAWRVFPSD